jgi:hypothetical protein
MQGTDVPARGQGKSALGGAVAIAREADSKCAGRRATTRERWWHRRLRHRARAGMMSLKRRNTQTGMPMDETQQLGTKLYG